MNTIRVSVAWAGENGSEQREISLQLPAPVTVQAAMQAAIEAAREMDTGVAAIASSVVAAGVWGKVRSLDHPLREGDRVELYRPLKADPKDARRANASRAPRKTKKM